MFSSVAGACLLNYTSKNQDLIQAIQLCGYAVCLLPSFLELLSKYSGLDFGLVYVRFLKNNLIAPVMLAMFTVVSCLLVGK